MITISKILELFSRVETPRYLDQNIQKIALSHLNVKDIGELRDKYDAQSYLNKLSDEIRSEYAFERFLGFDFDINKRMDKNYSRLEYRLNDCDIQISYFSSKYNPTISKIKPTVLIFLKPEKSAFIGPLIKIDYLHEIISKANSPMIKSKVVDLGSINFNNCIFFKNNEELLTHLKY